MQSTKPGFKAAVNRQAPAIISALFCGLLALSGRDGSGVENRTGSVGTQCQITDFNPRAERRVIRTTVRVKDERDRSERNREAEIVEEVQQCTSVRIECTDYGSTLIGPDNVVAYFAGDGRVTGRKDSFSRFRINSGETRQVSVCFDAVSSTIEKMALDY